MSIAPVAHVTLCGLLAEKGPVLRELQELGVAHLIRADRSGNDAAARGGASPSSRRTLRFLSGARHRWHQSHDRSRFDATAVEAHARAIEERMRTLAEERDALLHEIEALEPWGDFELPADAPPEVRFWFYIVPHHRMRAMPASLCWQVVQRDARFSYVVVIAPREPVHVPAARTHAGERALSALLNRLESVYVELDELEGERAREARWCDLLAASLDRLADDAALESGLAATHDDAPLFSVSLWVPQGSMAQIRELAQRRSLAWSMRPPLDSEQPPTLLENRGVSAFGQDLLRFYVVPRYGGWDPSASIFWFFAAFFAVMIADAGYAALLGGVLAIAWRPLGRSPAGARGRRWALVAVAASLAWGVAIGSYFGVAPGEGSPLAALVVFDPTDMQAYLRLAILLGAAQIAFANAALARHLGGRAAIPRLGWILVLGGALWIWLVPSPSGLLLNPGTWLVAVGLVAVAAFASERRSLAGRIGDGALALTRSIGLFADVLSYLRLFALAFSGAMLATQFNALAASAALVPGLGVLLAALVLALGHGANIGLTISSAVVHGMRLNLIEYLNWSVVDEGFPFERFERKGREA